jgi:hypothetical protein
MDKPQILIHAELSLGYTCYDCKWIPKSARFAVLGCLPKGTGIIELMTLNKGKIDSQHKVCILLKIRFYSLRKKPVLNVVHLELHWKIDCLRLEILMVEWQCGI